MGTHDHGLDQVAAMKGNTLRLFGGGALLVLGIFLRTALLDDLPIVTHDAGDRAENTIELLRNRPVGQTVRPPTPNLSGVELLLSTLPGKPLERGEVFLRIRRSPTDSEDLRTATVPASSIRLRNAHTRFRFPALQTGTEDLLYVVVEYPEGTLDRPLRARIERPSATDLKKPWNDYPDGTAFADGAPLEGDLQFRLLRLGRRPFGTQVSGMAVLGGLALLAKVFVPHARRAPSTLVLALGLPVIFLLPLAQNIGYHGIGDWDMNTTLHATAERALLAERTFPGWNPFLCGGTPLAAFPEAPVFSPFFTTVLLLGPLVGFKLNIFLHGTIGFLGMLLWLRWGFRTSWLAAFLGASAVMFSSFLPLHLAGGHSRKIALAWIPWTLFFLHRALELEGRGFSSFRRSWRFAVPAAAALAFLLLDGSVYLSLYTATFVALVCVFFSGAQRRWPPLATGLLVLALAGALAGIRLVPALISQSALHPAITLETKPLPLRSVIDVFLDPNQDPQAEKFPAQPFPWYEYGAYVGIAPMALSLLGALAAWRRSGPWIGAGTLFALGASFGPVQQALALVPFLGDLRNPQRMAIMVTVALGVASALGLDRFVSFLGRPPARLHPLVRASLGVLVALVVGNLIFVNSGTLSNIFVLPPPGAPLGFAERILKAGIPNESRSDRAGYPKGAPSPAAEAPFRQSWAPLYTTGIKDSFPFTMANTLSNRGSVNRCSVAGVQPSLGLRLPPEDLPHEVVQHYRGRVYDGETFFAEGTGTATVEAHRTSEVRVRYHAETPAVLALNENFHPGWHARILPKRSGTKETRNAVAHDGLVATRLAPGSGSVIFFYRPPGLGMGLLLTAAGLAVALWLWRVGFSG